MKKFYHVFIKRARKPGYWVIFTTRVVIGVLVAVIAKLIINQL